MMCEKLPVGRFAHFLNLPITLNVRFPSLLARTIHWPGCTGGSRRIRYRPSKCSNAARGPVPPNRDWLWSDKERKEN